MQCTKALLIYPGVVLRSGMLHLMCPPTPPTSRLLSPQKKKTSHLLALRLTVTIPMSPTLPWPQPSSVALATILPWCSWRRSPCRQCCYGCRPSSAALASAVGSPGRILCRPQMTMTTCDRNPAPRLLSSMVHRLNEEQDVDVRTYNIFHRRSIACLPGRTFDRDHWFD
jgi:hypothetical protein